MNDYILLMHNDLQPDRGAGRPPLDWGPYLARLRETGCFGGGSAMGDGVCVRKAGSAPEISAHLVGYIRVRAEDLEAAQRLVESNPVFEAGGTVEVRELPPT